MRKEVIEVVGLSGPTDLLMPALRPPPGKSREGGRVRGQRTRPT